MILRKVSNLKPGDNIRIHLDLLEVESVYTIEFDRVEVHVKSRTIHVFHRKDYVEIMIL